MEEENFEGLSKLNLFHNLYLVILKTYFQSESYFLKTNLLSLIIFSGYSAFT